MPPPVHLHDADRGDGAHHDAVDQSNRRAHGGHRARQPDDCGEETLQPVAHIGMLAPAAVEQLDRDDVGEGVDQPAVEDRALVGGGAAGSAHFRQQEPDDPGIAQEPQRHDQPHPRVDRDEDGDRQHHEGQERPHGLQHVDDEIADRLAALHDLGGDTAGEIVLVEGVGLLDDAPERLPAHHRVEARHDHLLLDDGRADHHQRAHDQKQPKQAEQFRPMFGEERLRVRRVEQIDQPADRPVERRVNRAGEAADDEQQEKRALRLAGEIEDELPGGVRQHLAVGVVEGVDRALEPPPQACAEAVFLLRHSAAMSLAAEGSACGSCASSSRKPPDWRSQSWA